MGFNKIWTGCRKCPYADTCENRRMEAHGYLPMLEDATQGASADAAAPVLQPHEYRNIKLSEGMTITIDIVELKEQMVKEHYSGLYSPLMQWGG